MGGGAGGIWAISIPSQFYCKPKTTLKKKEAMKSRVISGQFIQRTMSWKNSLFETAHHLIWNKELEKPFDGSLALGVLKFLHHCNGGYPEYGLV